MLYRCVAAQGFDVDNKYGRTALDRIYNDICMLTDGPMPGVQVRRPPTTLHTPPSYICYFDYRLTRIYQQPPKYLPRLYPAQGTTHVPSDEQASSYTIQNTHYRTHSIKEEVIELLGCRIRT